MNRFRYALWMILVTAACLAADGAFAARGGGGGGGARGGGGWHGGHGGHSHGRHHGHSHSHFSFGFVGAFGWPWYYPGWGYPYYSSYYPYAPHYEYGAAPYYYTEAAQYQSGPGVPLGVAQQQEPAWYFCAPLNAYYPYVTQCPDAQWQRVSPTPPPGSDNLSAPR